MFLSNLHNPSKHYIRIRQIFQWVFSFELFFILFLFAGVFKGDPRLAQVPVDLTAFFFGISVILGIVILANKGFKFKRKALILVLLYIAFAGYVLLSYLWTPSIVYSTQKVFYIWTLVLWALAAPALIISVDYSRLKRLGAIYFLLSTLVVCVAIMQYFKAGNKGFISVFDSCYLGTGYAIGIALVLIFVYLLFWVRNRLERVLACILIGIYFWVLLIMGGRGPMLASIVGMFIPLVFAISFGDRKPKIRIKKYVTPILLMMLLLIIFIIFFAESGRLTITLSRMLVLLDADRGASAGARLQFYQNAIEYFKQAPLFGYGIGSWPIINDGIDLKSYPHNIILEILVELGMVGLLIFSGFVAYALSFLVSFRSIADNPMKLLLTMMIMFVLIICMISGDIPESRLIFACIGLMPAAIYIENRNKIVI